jgi:hypothetical protein
MPGPIYCGGAALMCTFGAAPGTLIPKPGTVLSPAMPVATIMDMAPVANVPPFGVCNTMSNPAVAAATAAALGALTPMPCVPVPAGTWLPGKPTVLVGGLPVLTADSKLTCAWGGVISITFPGQTKTNA